MPVSSYGGNLVKAAGITRREEYMDKIEMVVCSQKGTSFIFRVYRKDLKDIPRGYHYNVDEYQFRLPNKKFKKLRKELIENHWVDELPHPKGKIIKYDIDGVQIISYLPLDIQIKKAITDILSGRYRKET